MYKASPPMSAAITRITTTKNRRMRRLLKNLNRAPSVNRLEPDIDFVVEALLDNIVSNQIRNLPQRGDWIDTTISGRRQKNIVVILAYIVVRDANVLAE